MTNRKKRNALVGGLAGVVLGVVMLGPVRTQVAYGDTLDQGPLPTDDCSSGVRCGGSCCNNRTDKCCKGSCIGANDRCM